MKHVSGAGVRRVGRLLTAAPFASATVGCTNTPSCLVQRLGAASVRMAGAASTSAMAILRCPDVPSRRHQTPLGCSCSFLRCSGLWMRRTGPSTESWEQLFPDQLFPDQETVQRQRRRQQHQRQHQHQQRWRLTARRLSVSQLCSSSALFSPPFYSVFFFPPVFPLKSRGLSLNFLVLFGLVCCLFWRK